MSFAVFVDIVILSLISCDFNVLSAKFNCRDMDS